MPSVKYLNSARNGKFVRPIGSAFPTGLNAGTISVDYLIISGGGGGSFNTYTGGGGGAATASGTGGSGGSGLVIIRYAI